MSTSWHSICHPGLPICIQRPRIGAGTQSANAVRKEWRDEKAICNDVEYRHDDFPGGHGWNGADVLPRRGGISEGHADADRQEPGCSGASLAGWCSVAGHPVAAEPGHPVAALGQLPEGLDARERGRGGVQGREVVRGGRQGQGGDGAAEEVVDADEATTGPGVTLGAGSFLSLRLWPSHSYVGAEVCFRQTRTVARAAFQPFQPSLER